MVVMGNPLGDTKTVGTLLQLGADPLLQDGEGWNALHWAAFHSNVGAVEVMMESASASVLHMLVQKNKQETLEYRLAGQSGPDHDKRFTMELLLNSNVFASGTGRSKKEAEQLAAKKALEIMGC